MGEVGGGPYLVLGMLTVEVFAWVLLMVAPYGWQKKMTFLFKFDAGLYEATVQPGPASMLAMSMMKSVRNALSSSDAEVFTDSWFGGKDGKQYSLSHLEGLFCQHGVQMLVGNFCEGFHKLHVGSLILIFIAGTAVIFLLLGGYFYYHYWFVKPSERCYNWVVRFFVLAPVLFEVGVAIYAFFASDVNKMDPPNVPGFHYSFFAACILSVLAWLPLLVQNCFIGLHPLQEAKESAAMKLEDDLGVPPPTYGSMQGYGAGDAEYAGGGLATWGQQSPGYAYGPSSYQTPAPGFAAGYSPAPPLQSSPPAFQQSAGYAGGMPAPPGSGSHDTGILPVSEGEIMPELRARTLGPGEL
mmetsp:Transcript_45222/g.104859  ORF Transcript_45222/g.104859 Transcript_45222/m.104859 type:complete len:354 (+) Transcript_45222:132-1193(+)